MISDHISCSHFVSHANGVRHLLMSIIKDMMGGVLFTTGFGLLRIK